MTHRGKFEMVIDFLDTVKQYPNFAKTRMLNHANISTNRQKQFLVGLNDKGFIDEVRKGKRSSTLLLTEKGSDWLRRAKQVLEEMKTEACERV